VNKGIFKDKRNNRRFLNGLMKAKWRNPYVFNKQ
jgi:hypothetical protein